MDDKTLPGQCSPEVACLGGVVSACAANYRGDFCSECVDGRYRLGPAGSGAECLPCSDKGSTLAEFVLLWATLGVFVALLCASIVLLDDMFLDRTVGAGAGG